MSSSKYGSRGGSSMRLQPISEWQDVEFGSPDNNLLDESDDGIFEILDETGRRKQTGKFSSLIRKWLPFAGGNGYQQPTNIRVIHPPFDGTGDVSTNRRNRNRSRCKRIIIVLILMISVLMLLAVGYASVRKIQQEGSDRNNNTLPVIDVRPDPAQSYFEWLVRNPLVRTLRFEDISSFSVPGSTEYNWARSKPDGSYLEFDSANNQILLKSLDETSTPVVVATSQDMQELSGHSISSKFQLSADGSHLLVQYDERGVWRSSTRSHFSLLNLSTKRWTNLPRGGNDPDIVYAKWSPSPDFGLIYNRNRDLFWFDGDSNHRLTFDGSANSAISNGVADWVYEEEVFGNSDCSWWSPDGQRLAYLSFDETNVLDYPLAVAEVVSGNQYPSRYNIKYPKPGTPNPKVALRVVTFSSKNGRDNAGSFVSLQLNLPTVDDGDRQNKDGPIVFGVYWVPDSQRLLVKLTNRNQDTQLVVLYDLKDVTEEPSAIADVKPRIVREEQRAWFEHSTPLIFLKTDGGEDYVDLAPVDGYLHLAKFSVLSAQPTMLLTQGPWEVTDLLGQMTDGRLLFVATAGVGGTQRNVYALAIPELNSNSTSSSPTPLNGMTGYYEASMSPGGSWVLLSHRGPQVPFEQILHFPAASASASASNTTMANRTISDKAKDLARSLAEYTLPTPEIIQIPIGELNITLNARILWPPAVQKNLSHFYPLIVKVYGGPNSQQVDEQWSAGFDDFLAGNWHQSSRTIFQKERLANRNVTFNILQRRGPSAIQPPPIVLTVDPRGTCCRGLEFMFSVNRRLGFYEAKDVVAAVKRFVSDSPFIDPDKVGVWGWSYGGYLTAKIIEADFQSTASIFKSAVSVAPVTDWLLYDSIYTERYMKRPADNKEAYRESAVSNVQALKSIRYLAIHGTADDNVHVEQSLRLEYLFRLDSPNNGTNYRLHLVADDNHSMYRTANARTFVFRTLTDWMVNAWQEIDDLRRT